MTKKINTNVSEVVMNRKWIKRLLIGGAALLPLLFVSCGSDEKPAADTQAAAEHGHDDNQLWTCGMHPEVILDEPGQCPKCGMNLVPVKGSGSQASSAGAEKPKGERKVLYWQAPMNPTEIYDKPGKSNMGMDLVPVYEDEVNSGSMVKVDPTTVQNMGVRMAFVEKRDFSRVIRTVGKIGYNEENIYAVSTRISGWIEKLKVNYTGEEVRKGQELLEIYSPELVTTQQEYLLALKNRKQLAGSKFASIREGAEDLVRASRQRLEYWDIPESSIRRLEESGEVRKTLALEAPHSGVVINKNADEGQFVKAGMTLYHIADLSTVWVDVSIYDNEAPWVKVGATAGMELSYLPGKTFEGRVSYIYPYLDEKARDIKVRMEFKNPGLELKPGMYANIHIDTPPVPDALVVPSEAVIRSGQRNLVFISRDKGRFEPREVILGEESEDGKVRIISGVLEGEKVVISAQFLLDSESRLQEAIQKMLAAKSAGKSAKKQSPAAGEKAAPASGETMKKQDAETGGEMKCGDGMDMEGKNMTSPGMEEHEKNSEGEMKCGDGMDMSGKGDMEKDGHEDHGDH
ncbi:MAG TPA: efflux RND transporter periplasmic adaptor subunit [Caldithrix abyssi]|uniref:Efflux RND transporter periplasmic adaptor subunit n=1 Tax=Caldithrix abyssi TaxID=187145 RepID=A0A7V5VFN0_CALAY|nr:efflux RND transporter periplasmic adaptor subunit [Caldithrix abyssi]